MVLRLISFLRIFTVYVLSGLLSCLVAMDLVCCRPPWSRLPFLRKFYFGTKCAILGGRSILGGLQGSWRPGMLGLLECDPWRLSVGPVAAMVPSNYSFY